MTVLDPTRDRVAVVTGAGTGIGQAIAARFGALGWKVGVGGRRVALLDETRARVEAAGGTGLAHPLDVTDPDSVEAFFTAVEADLGPVTVVVNNAAMARYGPLDDFSPEEIEAEVATKLLGSLSMARRGIQTMRAGGVGGDILFITSLAAVQPWPFHLPYAAANAGVEQATRSLRLELEGTGIRVTMSRCGETGGTDFATREIGGERALVPPGPAASRRRHDPGDGRRRGRRRGDAPVRLPVRDARGHPDRADRRSPDDLRVVRRDDDADAHARSGGRGPALTVC